ncbi:MAG: invasion associated locus B family protein [Proteobacteria bacterium]|nr:invasion associated locus B family protein [Pseudomonadota bacterium]
MSRFFAEGRGLQARGAVLGIAVAVAAIAAATANLLWQRSLLYARAGEIADTESRRPPPAPGSRFGLWTLVCPTAVYSPGCVLAANVTLANWGNLPLEIRRIEAAAAGRRLEMRVTLPLGTGLRRGMTVDVPDFERFDVAFESCSAAGCVAAFQPSPLLWLGLRTRQSVDVEFRRMGEGRDLAARVPLAGLADALAALR